MTLKPTDESRSGTGRQPVAADSAVPANGQTDAPPAVASQPVATPPAVATANAETDGAAADAPQAEPAPVVPKPAAPTSLELTPVAIQARMKQVEEAADLTDDVRKNILDRYRQALESLKLADDAVRLKAQFAEDVRQAPHTISTLRAESSKPTPETRVEPPPDASLVQLEGLLAQAEAAHTVAKRRQEELDAEAGRRNERKPKLPALVERAKQQLEETKTSLKAPSEGETPQQADARRTELEARRSALERQIEMYEAEAHRYEVLSELLPLRRDRARREAVQTDKLLAAWRKTVADFRREEAERQARDAREAVADAHPALKALAIRNAELAEQRVELSKSIDDARTKLESTTGLTEQIDKEFEDVKRMENAAGLTTGVGLLLRTRRAHLPNVRRLKKRLAEIEAEIPRRQLEQLEVEGECEQTADEDSAAAEIISGLNATVRNDPRVDVEQLVAGQLADRRKLLNDLRNDYETSLSSLAKLDVDTRSLITKTNEFAAHIDERVLWVKSTSVLSPGDAHAALEALQAFSEPGRWTGLVHAVEAAAVDRPVTAALFVVLCVLALGFGQQIRRALQKQSDAAMHGGDHGFRTTVKAVAISMLAASIWPAVVGLAAWQLSSGGKLSEFARGAADALGNAAIVWWTLSVLRQFCRSHGVAEVHFHWPVRSIRLLRSSLLRQMIICVPIVFLVTLTDAQHVPAWSNSLGRAAFILGNLSLAVFLYRALRPRRGILAETLAANPDGWLSRLRFMWFPVVVAAPTTLAVLAHLGYYYTAEQLFSRLIGTFWLGTIAVVANALGTRWLYLLRGSLENMQTDEQAKAEIEEQADAAVLEEKTTEQQLPESTHVHRGETSWMRELDVVAVEQQLRRLLHGAVVGVLFIGAWMIWANVLPALGVFDRVELWSTTARVAETIEQPDGKQITQMVDREKPTTLGHLILAFLVVGGTIAAGRNVPGLIDVTILKRLPMDGGGRNAVTTICRYVLTLLGIVLACRIVGLTWGSVQWLAAAMTVGLGFGLQEIFANFVSGLILLFERPIRVGDLVTVGDVSGLVSKMQIRATTITDFDRRELVVPNKKFITDEFVNWTLSDPVTRVVLQVGVAYGSDTALAHKLLLKTAEEHPAVLAEPEPTAMFKGFGDSTLDFELRVFIPRRDVYPILVHELNTAINREFAAHDIEIAFPQRDLNIRSIEGLAPILPMLRQKMNREETGNDAKAVA